MTNVYLFCLTLGFVFTVVGSLLGHLVGGGDGADGGADAGGDAGIEGPEFSHGYEAGVGDGGGLGEGDIGDGGGGGPLAWPVLSPTVIPFFVTTFGGSGLIYQYLFGDHAWVHVPAAMLTSLSLGLLLAWGIYKITTTFDRSRMARASDALGALAEVSVTIPADGVGEIAYVSGGTRQTLTARSSDGRVWKQGATVRVLKLADGTAVAGEPPAALAPVAAGEEAARGEPVRQPVRR